MTVIAPNVVLKKLLGPAKSARKNVKTLTEVCTLVNVLPNQWSL